MVRKFYIRVLGKDRMHEGWIDTYDYEYFSYWADDAIHAIEQYMDDPMVEGPITEVTIKPTPFVD